MESELLDSSLSGSCYNRDCYNFYQLKRIRQPPQAVHTHILHDQDTHREKERKRKRYSFMWFVSTAHIHTYTQFTLEWTLEATKINPLSME